MYPGINQLPVNYIIIIIIIIMIKIFA